MNRLPLDVHCILLTLLSGKDAARMARVNQTYRITVAKFFKRTKELILTDTQYIDATKLSRWPLLSVLRTIEIHNLYVHQNVRFNFSVNLLAIYLSCSSSYSNNTISFNSTPHLQGQIIGGQMQIDSGDFDCEIGFDAVWIKNVGEHAVRQELYTDPEDEVEHHYEKMEEETNVHDYNFLEYMIAEAEDMELEE